MQDRLEALESSMAGGFRKPYTYIIIGVIAFLFYAVSVSVSVQRTKLRNVWFDQSRALPPRVMYHCLHQFYLLLFLLLLLLQVFLRILLAA
ncbi:hypothetical protein BDQ17DRAFT_1353765 [Cyathus striatus]|nr:hypothetical protein BDQ17DRAFT_1353765 [Cyathus striatus]